MTSRRPFTGHLAIAAPPGNGPITVRAGFMLYDINEIEETTETFEFEGALLLSWDDPRQAFDPAIEGVEERVYKGEYQFAELFEGWWPQVVLANQSGNLDRQGVVLRVEPDGTVWYVEELDAIAESPMDPTERVRRARPAPSSGPSLPDSPPRATRRSRPRPPSCRARRRR